MEELTFVLMIRGLDILFAFHHYYLPTSHMVSLLSGVAWNATLVRCLPSSVNWFMLINL